MLFRKQLRDRYEPLIPPMEKPFEAFSEKEAEAFFQWYRSHVEERILYLGQISEIDMDYSLKSLRKLWKWFLKHGRVENTPPQVLQEIYEEIAPKDRNLADIVVKGEKYRLTIETEYLIRDIAMYVGEMFCRNYSSLSWGYYRDRKDSFRNMPVILGFEDSSFSPPFYPTFEPNHMVGVQASALLSGKGSPGDLLAVYENWSRWAK